MKIEVLFPDLCNLYGDNGNVQYLAASLPEAEVVFTGNLETPRFTKEPVDLIYLGSMSEAGQELAIQRLLPKGRPPLVAQQLQEVLGEARIQHQKWSQQVGSKEVLVMNALHLRLQVDAIAAGDLEEGMGNLPTGVRELGPGPHNFHVPERSQEHGVVSPLHIPDGVAGK